MPRDRMRCCFGREDIPACLAGSSKPGNPLHVEAVLADLGLPRLGVNPFAGTQHDHGHMAPNNAFS